MPTTTHETSVTVHCDNCEEPFIFAIKVEGLFVSPALVGSFTVECPCCACRTTVYREAAHWKEEREGVLHYVA